MWNDILECPADFGSEYFEEKDEKKAEVKTWVDKVCVMAVRTNSSRMQGAFSRFNEHKLDAWNEISKKCGFTAKSTFVVRYLRDILNFLDKWGNDEVEIECGNDVPMTIRAKDEEGVFIEFLVAPRIHQKSKTEKEEVKTEKKEKEEVKTEKEVVSKPRLKESELIKTWRETMPDSDSLIRSWKESIRKIGKRKKVE